jgi:hypothetical protein
MPSWLFFSSRTSRPTFFFYLLNSLHLPKRNQFGCVWLIGSLPSPFDALKPCLLVPKRQEMYDRTLHANHALCLQQL